MPQASKLDTTFSEWPLLKTIGGFDSDVGAVWKMTAFEKSGSEKSCNYLIFCCLETALTNTMLPFAPCLFLWEQAFKFLEEIQNNNDLVVGRFFTICWLEHQKLLIVRTDTVAAPRSRMIV